MEREKLIERLMVTFLGEFDDHARAFSQSLLELERKQSAQERAELLKTLFRTAHTLKGAARSVDVGLVEQACHRLEGIFGSAQEGRAPIDAELLQLLFAVFDGIVDVGRRLRENQSLENAPLARLLPQLEAVAKLQATGSGPSVVLPAATPANPAPVRTETGDLVVRVPAAKLDGLLAHSGELLVARRRLMRHAEDMSSLLEFAKAWKSDWEQIQPILREYSQPNGSQNTRPVTDTPARRGERRSHRRQLAIEHNLENLRRLSTDVDRLAMRFNADLRAIEQVAGTLDEEVRWTRMAPFAEACEGLERTVRDLARASAKEVEWILEGGEIELDRSILQRLRDPLLHLLRNAVDHGIESPSDRRTAGKPSCGRVCVTAKLRGARVEITVADDGRGLDVAALRERAQRLKLTIPSENRELERLALEPGVSTAGIITMLSGRGVGLDIVRTQVEAMYGSVEIVNQPGVGARFVLTVPLTLTTIRGILVASGGQTFAMPGINVEKLLRIAPEDIRFVEGRESILLGASPVPVVSLAATLGLREREALTKGAKAPAVTLVAGGQRLAVTVDSFLAEQEIVIKTLGPRLAGIKNVIGATLLPAGSVALILDVAALIRTVFACAPGQVSALAVLDEAPDVKKRLLVVDDSVTTRTLVRSILEASGYEVTAAADGAEAWRLLQENGADLLVTDIEMPRMDGFTLTEAVRNSKRFRNLPIVLVTAMETDADKARGLEVGADAYLLKSAFDQTELLQIIGQLL